MMSNIQLEHRDGFIHGPRVMIDEAEARLHYSWESARGWIEDCYTRVYRLAARESHDLAALEDSAALADMEFLHSQAPSLPFHGHCVYLLRDEFGGLLYVGQSKNAWRRIGAHADKDWGHHIDSVSVIPCASRRKALDLESRLIAELHPRFNVALNWRRTVA